MKLNSAQALLQDQLDGDDTQPLDLSYWSHPHAHFKETSLAGATFHYTDLRHAILEDVNLRGSDFYRTKLTGAKFSYSDLANAYFVSCDLRGADLSHCHCKNTRFYLSLYNDDTILPFSRAQAQEKGMVYISENKEDHSISK